MKKPNTKFVLVFMAAGILFTGSLSATAQPGPGGRPDRRSFPADGPRPERPFEPGAGMAGPGTGLFQAFAVLTPEQRNSFREQLRDEGEQLRGSEQKMREARSALMKAAFSKDFNEKAVRRHAATVAKLEADRTVRMAKVLSQIEPPLSPEQRERLQNPPPPGRLGERRGPALGQGAPPRDRDEPMRPREKRRP